VVEESPKGELERGDTQMVKTETEGLEATVDNMVERGRDVTGDDIDSKLAEDDELREQLEQLTAENAALKQEVERLQEQVDELEDGPG
jgi:peptidoglycan hydrolase CwlO-like protein